MYAIFWQHKIIAKKTFQKFEEGKKKWEMSFMNCEIREQQRGLMKLKLAPQIYMYIYTSL